MTHKIKILPSQTEFNHTAEQSILSAALAQGINLPHACQNGVCGSCVATLLSGSVSNIDNISNRALSENDIQAGKVLLCCCQADEDVVLDMPTFAGTKNQHVRTLPARITYLKQHHQVAIMRLALPKAPPFVFYAGQYVDFLLKEGTRSYSIASAPSQAQFLEFHIKHREKGLFSSQLFDGRLKVGSIIRLRGALGSFTLNEQSDKPLILVATGTGFAPIKAILNQLVDEKSQRAIHFYYGNRHREDFYDNEALQDLLNQLPNARYTPVLSQPDHAWQGKKGYVGEHILADYPDLSGHEVYACGLPKMILSCKTALTQKAKLPEHAFFSDAFVASLAV